VPRGLAASVLAGLPKQAGIPGGELIESAAFGVVLFTIVGASVLSYCIERPFVDRMYRPFFRRYLERIPEIPPSEPATAADAASAGAIPLEPDDELSDWPLEREG
jgi:hypothetical protein